MDLPAICARAAQLHRAGNSAQAERLYLDVLAADPDYVPALSLLGVLRSGQGNKPEALELMAKAARLGPGSFPAQLNHATLLQELGRLEEALSAFDRALALKPDVAVFNNRGNVLKGLGRLDEALASFDRALALEPQNAAVCYNRALTLQQMGRPEQALEAFARASLLKPDFAPGWASRALLAQGLRRHDEALQSYGRLLALEPDNAGALAARGYLFWDRYRNFEAAVADLERAVALDPNAAYARGDLLHLKMHGADWRGFEAERAAIDAGVQAGRRIIRPFAYQALSSSPADLHAASVIYTNDAWPPQPPLWRPDRGPQPRARHPKIRVGYVCGAFGRHALSYLAAGLYERHDRSAFEIIAFDTGRDDASAMRARLVAGFDKFISLAGRDDDAAARAVFAEETDILVNVDGYSGNFRMGIFARRPAPLQVNWLGYPGTLGADYMDYLIADKVVVPPGEEAHYSEKLVIMPGAYQVNDSSRVIAAAIPSRASQGLPEQGFVFCNFNQSYKITPSSFASFLAIMLQVPGSVLWLLEANPAFARNLRAEAQRRGVAGERLVLAATLPLEEHLARLKLADLFLDSLPYNAHTTASDALWAGVPLLTQKGTTFPGRVAASLLQSVGLPEMVTHDAQAFESLAVKLAREPALLADIRARLAQSLKSAPLFDTGLYCRHLEQAYRAMWEKAARAEAPASFAVPM